VRGGLHRSAAWLERKDRAVGLEECSKVEILANCFPDPRRLAGALVVQLRQAVHAHEQGRMTFALLATAVVGSGDMEKTTHLGRRDVPLEPPGLPHRVQGLAVRKMHLLPSIQV